MAIDIFSAGLLICEKILEEKDGVMSAVRIVDVFYISLIPDVPVEAQAIKLAIWAQLKSLKPGEAGVVLELVRPDGQVFPLMQPMPIAFKEMVPGAACGVVVIAFPGIRPNQLGLHYIRILVDGNDVARAPFTLAERPEGESPE